MCSFDAQYHTSHVINDNRKRNIHYHSFNHQ